MDGDAMQDNECRVPGGGGFAWWVSGTFDEGRTANVPLLRKVLEHVEQHPDEWDQSSWATVCGTKFCFAGHALVMTGHKVEALVDDDGDVETFVDGRQADVFDVTELGAEALGIGIREARHLFDADNTLSDLRVQVENIVLAAGDRL